MRAITKSQEPTSLTNHRAQEAASYDNCSAGTKQDLRVSLVAEQRGLCCYCMASIHPTTDSMKIEHWRSRQGYQELQLVYANMLAACRGGDGQPHDLQHCDTRKGQSDLKFSPADPAHQIEHRMQFRADGAIASSDKTFDAQLNEVLGLNIALIRNRRKALLDGMLDWWRRYRELHHRSPPRHAIQRERQRWAGGVSELKAYAPVALWWLDQRITRGAA